MPECDSGIASSPTPRVQNLLFTGFEMSENRLGWELFLTIANQIRFPDAKTERNDWFNEKITEPRFTDKLACLRKDKRLPLLETLAQSG